MMDLLIPAHIARRPTALADAEGPGAASGTHGNSGGGAESTPTIDVSRIPGAVDESRPAAEASAAAGPGEAFVAMLLREPYKSSSFYVCELVRGATAYLESVGLRLSIVSTPPSRWDERFGDRCVGVLVIPTQVDEPDLSRLDELGCPYVTIADSNLPGPTVSLSLDAAASQLTELLLDCGHRRFALVSGHDHHTDAVKRRAILRILGEAGIEAADVPDLRTNYDPVEAEAAAESLLSRDRRPTAVIGFNDDLAVHVLTTALRSGFAVPEEISVAGFNDGPSAALLFPRLTTVRLPIAEAGQAAAESIWQAHREKVSPLSVTLQSTLVVRDSIGLAP